MDIISKGKIKNGLINIRTLHTTTAITINENESGLMKDLIIFLKKLVSKHAYYNHDDLRKRKYEPEDAYKRKNGFSHIQSLLLGTTVTLPIIKEKINLGQWQSILFVELDGPRKDRKIQVTILEAS